MPTLACSHQELGQARRAWPYFRTILPSGAFQMSRLIGRAWPSVAGVYSMRRAVWRAISSL